MAWKENMNLKFLLIIICLIETALVSMGCGRVISQTGDASLKSASLDQLIDVRGYRLHIVCDGQAVKGQPTVILDAGGGSSSSSWKLVQPEVAKFARVCSYDRPGLGRSERKPKPYTSLDVMKDLHTLLAKAKIGKPYAMAGHSLGGMHIRLFAKLYPKEVVGMVFVDSFNEDELAPERSTISPEVKKQYPPDYFKPFISEDMDLETIAAQARANKWYGSIPVIVLTRAPLKSGQAEKSEQLRIDLQNDLARRSTNSKHIIAEKSGHNIQDDQPEIVVDSIRQIMEATRTKDNKWPSKTNGANQ